MSAKATTTSIALNLKLENGTTTAGEVKTVSQTMGSINKDAMDIDKALLIAVAIAPCLEKSLHALEQTVKSNITNAA